MIYIKIELWPYGDKTKAKTLGEAYIANDATGDSKTGNYLAAFLNGRKRIFRKSVVQGFPRKRLNVYDLLYRALKGAVGDRNDPKVRESAKERQERRDALVEGMKGTNGTL